MPCPVIDIAQMRAWEKLSWDQGKTEEAVIAAAGRMIARQALQMTRPGSRVLILSGAGHNGDDARQAAPPLAERVVDMLRVKSPEASFSALDSALALQPDLIIDGLFGIGLNRPLNESWIRFIERVNASGVPLLAVDTPSGLDADTGLPMGCAIRASVTVALGSPKKGQLAFPASEYVGRLVAAPEIGLSPCPFTNELNWVLPEDFLGYPPPRDLNGHKGAYGHLVVIAGSLGYHGAAVLAARAALRARPGLVTVWTLPEVYVPVASQLQAAMAHPWRPRLKLPDSATALMIGPGLAAPGLPSTLKNKVRSLWRESDLPVLVDASALDWLPEGPIASPALRLITPHPGEAARLLRLDTRAIQRDRAAAVRKLSGLFGNCWVILKGHQTITGRLEGPGYVNSSGNPYMAQGGSGDILAGYLGGLMAQPALMKNPALMFTCGVWRHGHAGDQLMMKPSSWTLEELVGLL